MKLPIISTEEFRKIAEKYGATPMPKDHPFYSEGPTIIFSSRTQKQSVQRGADSPRKDLPNDLDTQNKK